MNRVYHRTSFSLSLLALAIGTAIVGEAFCTPPLPRLKPSPVVIKTDYKDVAVRLRRIPLLDGNGQNPYVWQLIGRDSTSPEWAVYGSLYSPRLRAALSGYPAGTLIGREIQDSEPSVITLHPKPLTPSEIKTQREGRDFSDFCKVHGLQFVALPVI